MSSVDLRLEEALGAPDAQLEDVLDLVDESVEQAAAAGDRAALDRLAERLEEQASRGEQWRALAIAAARARALAGPPAPAPAPAPELERPAPDAPPAAAVSEPVYAGWWRRAAAFLLDVVVSVLALGALGASTGVESGLVDVVLILAYFAGFPLVLEGATPGKAVLGVAIRVADGTKLTAVRSLWRVVATCLLWVTVVGFVADLVVAAVDSRHRSVHDWMAGTVVLRTGTWVR